MAYQVLARKWRPQSFNELMGQEHVAQTLLNALKSSRMPHALLFTGPRGVGKTSAARILAKSLRCTKAKDFIPCGECADCQDIAAGHALDVLEIDGASNNGVENIRELRETVGYMPSRGQYKIYIIDEVHMLSTSAFNALLKTLEEPPPHVIFIFATTEVQKIPVTILSRCQRFDFRRIPARKVVERLKTIVDSEEVKAEPQALWLIARESEGSMRDSQSLLDQVITFCGKNVTHDQVVDVLGLTDRTLLSQTLGALINRDVKLTLDIIKKVFHLGYDPKQFAQDLLNHLRNLMIVKVTVSAQKQDLQLEFLDLPDEEIEELKKFSESLSEEDVHQLFDMTLKGVSDVIRAQDPRIVLEMLILRLTQAPRLVSIEKLLASVQNGEGALPLPAAKQATHAQTQTVDIKTTSRTPDKWLGVLEKIKREKPLLGAKLEYAALKVEDQKICLSYKKEQEFLYSQVNTQEVVSQLMDYVGKNWGPSYKLEIQLNRGESPTGPISPLEEKEQDHQKRLDIQRAKIESHPLVKEVKSALKGQITNMRSTNRASSEEDNT